MQHVFFLFQNKPFMIHAPKSRSSEKEDKKRDKDKEKEKEKHKEKDVERERDKEMEAMVTASEEKGTPMAWLNALVGRVCFDILRSAHWKKRLHQRLQKKLSTLKVGNFAPFSRSYQLKTAVKGPACRSKLKLDLTDSGCFDTNRSRIEPKTPRWEVRCGSICAQVANARKNRDSL